MTFGTNHPADARMQEPADEALERLVAIASLAGIAVVHALQLPAAFDEAGYLGGLFVAAVVASVLLAATLTVTGDVRALWAAGSLAGLLLLGYVISRTVGLPAATDDVGEWAEPPGLVAIVLEGLLVAVAVASAAAGRVDAPAGARSRLAFARGRTPGARPGPSAG
jgi:hypothetical protein